MSTTEELCQSLLKHKHLVLLKGKMSIEPLFPAFVMDLQYQEFCDNLSALKLTGEGKKTLNDWKKAYHLYTRDFFFAFNQDQTETVTDLMDALKDYISHDIEIVRYATYACVNDVDLDEQKILASAFICNVLTQVAIILHGALFATAHGKGKTNIYLERIVRCSTHIGKMLYTGDKHINPNENKRVADACQVLTNKLINWLFKESIKIIN